MSISLPQGLPIPLRKAPIQRLPPLHLLARLITPPPRRIRTLGRHFLVHILHLLVLHHTPPLFRLLRRPSKIINALHSPLLASLTRLIPLRPIRTITTQPPSPSRALDFKPSTPLTTSPPTPPNIRSFRFMNRPNMPRKDVFPSKSLKTGLTHEAF